MPRVFVLLAAAALATGACTSQEERGRRLYAQRGCAVCHGASGRGDGPSAKRLDTPPRDFADMRAYRQGASQNEIAASIRNGGGAMPAFRDVTESEASDIAAWIMSLQRSPLAAAQDADIAIRDAWVRESTATRTSSSGYFTIVNPTDKAVTLVKVSVVGVGHAQLHTMVDRQGQASMQPLATLQIPPRGSVEVAPGGTHLMLVDIARPLEVGTTVEMTLTFDAGKVRTVRAAVRPLSAMSAR